MASWVVAALSWWRLGGKLVGTGFWRKLLVVHASLGGALALFGGIATTWSWGPKDEFVVSPLHGVAMFLGLALIGLLPLFVDHLAQTQPRKTT